MSVCLSRYRFVSVFQSCVTSIRNDCSFTSECVDSNSECRDGICKCQIGLHHDQNTCACVTGKDTL